MQFHEHRIKSHAKQSKSQAQAQEQEQFIFTYILGLVVLCFDPVIF